VAASSGIVVTRSTCCACETPEIKVTKVMSAPAMNREKRKDWKVEDKEVT
jgi:hypothetical protein